MDFTGDFDAKIDHSLTQGSASGQKGNTQAVSQTSSTDDFEHVDPFSSHNLMDHDDFFNAPPQKPKEEANLLDDFMPSDIPKAKEPDFGQFTGLSDDFGLPKSQADTTKSFMDAERFQPIPPKAATPPLLDQIEDDYLNPYASQKEKFVSSEDFLEDFKEPPPPEKKAPAPEPLIPAKAPEPPAPKPAPAPQERPKAEPPKPPQAAAPVTKKVEERIAAEEMFCRIGLGESKRFPHFIQFYAFVFFCVPLP
ncbi:zyxin-like [Phlebotomus papatasi]|uniref:zyxin-like n=1 Tax=Phlebotomus papatasi TaxID=29031 RepID=UPI0024842B07|nr:zyxin-like [Phlebotomus papatasi]